MVNLNRMRTLIGIEGRMREKKIRAMARATKITTTISGMPHGSGDQSKVEQGALDIVEIEEAYAEVYADLAAMREELTPLIATMTNPDDIAALRYRYIMGIPLRDIPDMMCVSERAMFYHLSSGEHYLARTFPDNVSLH